MTNGNPLSPLTISVFPEGEVIPASPVAKNETESGEDSRISDRD